MLEYKFPFEEYYNRWKNMWIELDSKEVIDTIQRPKKFKYINMKFQIRQYFMCDIKNKDLITIRIGFPYKFRDNIIITIGTKFGLISTKIEVETLEEVKEYLNSIREIFYKEEER